MRPEYKIGIVILVLGLAGGAYLIFSSSSPMNNNFSGINKGIPYKEITNPSGFVNTDGITIADQIGKKVVLVDFMTYSCINCQRTIPHVVEWYEKYQDEGLEIIGIHTPEFAFEKDIDNVREAMKGFRVTYPVVLDNDYGTWTAYANRYWPRKYLIDIHGNIIYDHIGEGGYEETEAKIQEALRERAKVLGESAGTDTGGDVTDVSEQDLQVGSPEIYFGASRNEYLGNGPVGKTGEREFVIPTDTKANTLYLNGTWDVQPEYAASVKDAVIRFTYRAQDVYMVASGENATVMILRDGKPVEEFAGSDISAETGKGAITDERLYKLIHEDSSGEHTIEIQVKSGTIKAYTFTFG